MTNFLNGWRRKAGLLVLVLACVFTGGWVRSHSLEDVVTFQSGPQAAEYLISVDGSLVWERMQIGAPATTRLLWFTNKRPVRFGSLNSPDMSWSLRGGGFGVGEISSGRDTGTSMTLYAIPYWSIVIPLTMISACLLLWKSRKKPQCPSLQPKS